MRRFILWSVVCSARTRAPPCSGEIGKKQNEEEEEQKEEEAVEKMFMNLMDSDKAQKTVKPLYLIHYT